MEEETAEWQRSMFCMEFPRYVRQGWLRKELAEVNREIAQGSRLWDRVQQTRCGVDLGGRLVPAKGRRDSQQVV